MEFGVTGKPGGRYAAEQYRNNALSGNGYGLSGAEAALSEISHRSNFAELATSGISHGTNFAERVSSGISHGMSFAQLAAAKSAQNTAEKEQPGAAGMSFRELWQARFPGAYYHTMDASNIPQGVWERNDYPFEKFFREDLDTSVLNWKPNGANPAMDSSGVQSRLHGIAGQKSVIVPPKLEEKMKNDPELAGQVMAKVEGFIAENQVPGRICSHLIVLDENGEITRFRASSHGGNVTGPTEEEMRQFEADQAAKKKRREEYAKLNEESIRKRWMMGLCSQQNRAFAVHSAVEKVTELSREPGWI